MANFTAAVTWRSAHFLLQSSSAFFLLRTIWPTIVLSQLSHLHDALLGLVLQRKGLIGRLHQFWRVKLFQHHRSVIIQLDILLSKGVELDSVDILLAKARALRALNEKLLALACSGIRLRIADWKAMLSFQLRGQLYHGVGHVHLAIAASSRFNHRLVLAREPRSIQQMPSEKTFTHLHRIIQGNQLSAIELTSGYVGLQTFLWQPSQGHQALAMHVDLVLVELPDQWALLQGLHHQLHAIGLVDIFIAQMVHQLTRSVPQLHHQPRTNELCRKRTSFTAQPEAH